MVIVSLVLVGTGLFPLVLVVSKRCHAPASKSRLFVLGTDATLAMADETDIFTIHTIEIVTLGIVPEGFSEFF